jgi:hypothetical protein
LAYILLFFELIRQLGLLSIFIFEGGDVGYLKIISVLLMISSLAAYAKGIKVDLAVDAASIPSPASSTP